MAFGYDPPRDHRQREKSMNALRTVLGAALACAVVAGPLGCRFGDLQEDLERIDATVSIEGRVSCEKPHGKPLLVALLPGGDTSRVTAYRILSGPGSFRFT